LGKFGSLRKRLLAGIEKDPATDCWNWQGTKVMGYGTLMVRTHRLAYELFVGEPPDGRVLDHMCDNPSCCNPDHLRPATVRENSLRGDHLFARRARQTHCLHGHEMTAGNTYITPSTGRRQCRMCRRLRNRIASRERTLRKQAARKTLVN